MVVLKTLFLLNYKDIAHPCGARFSIDERYLKRYSLNSSF